MKPPPVAQQGTCLLKPKEAAAMLAISPRLLWSLTRRGAVRAVRIGRAVRYDLTDLLVWIEGRKTKLRLDA